MSVNRAKSEISSNEFLAWAEYLKSKVKIVQRDEYYLARIAMEIRILTERVNVIGSKKSPRHVRFKTFLFKFMTGEPKKPKPEYATVEEYTKAQKTIWGAVVGVPPPKE